MIITDNNESALRTSKEAFQTPNRLVVSNVQTQLPQSQVIPPKKQQFFKDEDRLSRLERYEEKDTRDEHNKPFVPPQGFKGPVPDRKNTDRCWNILVLAIYIGLGVYSYYVMADGNPNRLAYGMDFRGEVCGIAGLKPKPYLYFAGPVNDLTVTWCVMQCPPSSGRTTCMYDVDHLTSTPFCYEEMQADAMSNYCIPKEPQSRQLVLDELNSLRNVLRLVASDLWATWDITLVGFLLCILLSYLFTVFAKMPKVITPLIWSGIVGSLASFFLFAWFCWLEQARIYNFRCIPGTDSKVCGGWVVTFYQILTLVLIGFGGTYLLAMVFLYRRIKRGIDLLKTASRITEVLGQIRAFPFMVAFFGLLICSLAFILIINAMTVGTIELSRASNISGHLLYKIYYNTPIQLSIIFVLFTVVFSLALILTMNDMFTSYALSVWFFTKKKDAVHIPFFFTLRTLFRYHFGTCVFITFNLMFLTIPQSLMSYFRTFIRFLPQTSNVVRFTQATCMVCIHSFEIFLRYISKHSVVQVAIWSQPYYQSAKQAYFLVFRNQNKIKDLDFLTELIVFQLRLATSTLAAIPIYIYVSFATTTFFGYSTAKVITPIVPTFYVLFCGMFFTSIFQGSYDITCKTIIQLYCMDCEMFFGEQRFAEQFIRDFMEFVGKIEDNEWRMGFNKQIKFDIDRYQKQLARGSQDGSSDEAPEGEDDQIDEDKYSHQEIDYDEKEERNNPFIGLPTGPVPQGTDQQRVSDELGNGDKSQTMILEPPSRNNPFQMKGPILNNTQGSFQILLNSQDNDKSNISDLNEKPQKQRQQQQQKKVQVKQRL